MKNTKFTAGPWILDKHDVIRTQLKNDSYTTIVLAENIHGNTGNAALIAAAPEMYEALEFILQDGVIDALEITSVGKKAISKILRTLAKARGES